MKLQALFVSSAVAFSAASSTTLSDFPQCAQKCINDSASQLGGNPNDKNFICKSSTFLDTVHGCEAKSCNQNDRDRRESTDLFPLAIQLCESVGGTNAIGLGNLSSCAQPGLAIATAESGCSTTDWTCICKSSAYTIIAAEYEEQYCSPADRQAILDYTSAACAAVGVQLQPPTPGSSFETVSSVSSSLATTSSVPSIRDLPQCAQPCIDAALLQSGCQPSDWVCICVNPAFTGDQIRFCESQFCGTDDQNKIINISSAQCSAVNVTVVSATTNSPSAGSDSTATNPLQALTISSVIPTGSVQISVPQFSNLPQCGQFCATNATTKNGGSVTDLNLLCKNPSVLLSIGECESALCSPTDLQTIDVISQKICAPVGIGSINPTINPSAQPSVISAAYPTTTLVSSLDTIPPCAKPCLVTAFRESGCALDDIRCQCTSNAFTSLFSDCQAPVCGILDLQRLLPFTVKRCGSVGISLPSSILSIESDIAYAIPTTTDTLPTPTDFSNAPNDITSLPLCAQECIHNAALFAGCDIHNLTCICTNEAFNSYVGTCEIAACTADELQVIAAYATALCKPVPGHETITPSGTLLSSYLAQPTMKSTNASSTGGFFPKVSTFTGDAARAESHVIDHAVGVVIWILWTL